MEFVYLVISCSKTRFVRDYCLASLKKCGVIESQLFVTLDDHNDVLSYGIPIVTGGNGFIQDTIQAIEMLKNKYTHVILILNDFIFTSVSSNQILNLFSDNINYDYVRLTPSEYVRSFSREFIKDVPFDHPYYSSLQVAFWRIDYLIDVLKTSDNIWDVEKQKINRTHKYVSNPLMHYKHVVEKGEWDRRAKQIIDNAGFRFNSNGISHQYISFTQKIKSYITKIILMIFGYRLLK